MFTPSSLSLLWECEFSLCLSHLMVPHFQELSPTQCVLIGSWRAYVLLMLLSFVFLMVVLETNYLRMYRTSLRQIFKIGTVPIWVNIIILTFSQLLKGFCYGSWFVAWIGKNWLLCATSFCMLAFHNWWEWMHALTPLMIPVCLIKIWWTLVQ